MIQRNTTDTSSPNSWVPLVLVVMAALIVALFIWQPWAATSSRDTTTTTNQSTTTQTGP